MSPRVASLLVPLLLAALAPAHAQIRGGGPARPTGSSGWWFSGGAVVAGLGTVNDGRSGSAWSFSGDPRWQMRGTLEKATGPTTTLGLAVNFGNVDFRYEPLPGAPVPAPLPDEPTSVGNCRTAGCTGQLDLWGVHGVVRGGGAAEGLYQVVEVSGGVTGFRNLRAKADGAPLPADNAYDVNVGLGYGLGYAMSRDFHIAFVQDWGIAWHRGGDLPEGTGRTYQTRNSRITLRYGLGSFR